MLVQVKHRGWVLYKVFITKRGGGGVAHTEGVQGKFVKRRAGE